MMWFSLALAAGLDDADVVRLTGEQLGKAVPAKYVCIARPELDGVAHAPIVVGLKMKNVGCQLKGVVIDGSWHAPETALGVAVPTWGALDLEGRRTLGERWSRTVLFAWDQPLEAPEWQGTTSTWRVAHRVPRSQHAAESTVALTFAETGAVTREVSDSTTYKTGMTVRVHKTQGLSSEAATAGLSSVGKLVKECVRAQWARDLTSQGQTRLAWTVKEGKATDVRGRGDGSTELMRCYSGAIQQIAFEQDGTVDLQLTIQRTAVSE